MSDPDDIPLGPLSTEARDPAPVSTPEPPEKRRLPVATIGAVLAAGLVGLAIGQSLPDGTPRTSAPAPAVAPTRVAPPPAATKPETSLQVQVETKDHDAAPPNAPTLMPTVLPEPAPSASASASASTSTSTKVVAEAPPRQIAPPEPTVRVTRSSPPADPACAYAASDPESGCSDPDFIEADRELYAAYQAARGVGLPTRDLRADQAEWREVGEEAASRSRTALLAAYRDRTETVWGMIQAWQDQAEDDGFDRPRFDRR